MKALFTLVLVFALIVAAVVMGQWQTKAYQSQFGGHPDEPSHFVTGVMVRDYVSQGFPNAPIRFAQTYYDHYPKVALGHYPPAFYTLYLPWALLFPPSRGSALVFMALVSACLAVAVFIVSKSRLGTALSLLTALLLVSLPTVQTYSAMMMSDTTLALFCFLAAVSFYSYLERPRPRTALAFGVLSSLAIMTKGSGTLLVFLPVICMTLTGTWRALQRPSIWLAALPILVVCLPWMLATYSISREGWLYNWGPEYTANAMRSLPRTATQVAGYPVLLCAALGVVVLGVRALRSKQPISAFWGSLISLPLSLGLFYSVVPIGIEDRYLIPALLSVVILAMYGIRGIFSISIARTIRGARATHVLSGIAICALILSSWVRIDGYEFSGYGAVVDRILSTDPGVPHRILVSSDASGEGAVVAEVLVRDRARPSHSVFRGSKVLSTSDWMGRGYQLQYAHEEEVLSYLDRSAISWVIVDKSIHPSSQMPHHRLIENALDSGGSHFNKAGVFPITRGATKAGSELVLYGRRVAFPDGLQSRP
jgi:hypothetical protein